MFVFMFFFYLLLFFIRHFNADSLKKSSLFTQPKCTDISDCPKGSWNCTKVEGFKEKRCVTNITQVCTGGLPILPIRSCNRQRQCTDRLENFSGWCDFETKFCCDVPEDSIHPMTCPDRLTPLFGQEKCVNVSKTMIYSGISKQAGGLCYKGYSCPPKVAQQKRISFGSLTFRTNMDCYTQNKLDNKFNFMFCHNSTGNLWVIGQLNVNRDEVIKQWNQCELNEDCGKGMVCVKEDLCRHRCYMDPTTEMDYDWIVAQILAMFFVPIIFLSSIIFLTVKYLD